MACPAGRIEYRGACVRPSALPPWALLEALKAATSRATAKVIEKFKRIVLEETLRLMRQGVSRSTAVKMAYEIAKKKLFGSEKRSGMSDFGELGKRDKRPKCPKGYEPHPRKKDKCIKIVVKPPPPPEPPKPPPPKPPPPPPPPPKPPAPPRGQPPLSAGWLPFVHPNSLAPCPHGYTRLAFPPYQCAPWVPSQEKPPLRPCPPGMTRLPNYPYACVPWVATGEKIPSLPFTFKG